MEAVSFVVASVCSASNFCFSSFSSSITLLDLKAYLLTCPS